MATEDASAIANRSGMDPKRLAVIFYLVMGLILAVFFEHMLASIWAQFGWPDPVILSGPEWKVTTLLGYALSLGCALGCWFHPLTHRLTLECSTELMKVTWPTWPETRISTISVIIASLISAGFLFVADQISYHLMVEWLPKLWGKF